MDRDDHVRGREFEPFGKRNYEQRTVDPGNKRGTFDSGQQRLATEEFLLYSSHEKQSASHTQRVALVLSRSAKSALGGWEARQQMQHNTNIVAEQSARLGRGGEGSG